MPGLVYIILGFCKVLVPLFPKLHRDEVLFMLVLVRFTTKGGQEAKVSLAMNEKTQKLKLILKKFNSSAIKFFRLNHFF